MFDENRRKLVRWFLGGILRLEGTTQRSTVGIGLAGSLQVKSDQFLARVAHGQSIGPISVFGQTV